ncbi:hypothetical protein Tco_0544231 [Tanacetum coccineum]
MTRRLDMFEDVQVLTARGWNSRFMLLVLVFLAAIQAVDGIVDVARGSRLGAWLRACCLFIMPSKSRGVLLFHF